MNIKAIWGQGGPIRPKIINRMHETAAIALSVCRINMVVAVKMGGWGRPSVVMMTPLVS